MRMIVLFDLPTKTLPHRRQSRLFRRAMVRDGFRMLQESVYVRACLTREEVETHRRRLRSALPPEGSVRLFVMTEQQFAAGEILLGEDALRDQVCTNLLIL